jgi:hypothetical protein
MGTVETRGTAARWPAGGPKSRRKAGAGHGTRRKRVIYLGLKSQKAGVGVLV